MLFHLDHICAGYDKREVLHGVSLAVNQGENLLLAGPNGCGKSTLLKIAAGILQAQSGEVILDGQSLRRRSAEQRVDLGVCYLPQTRNLFPSLTVGDNLRLSVLQSCDTDFRAKLEWVLGTFPFLRGVLGKRAGLLSGGERQALATSMVLIKRPRVLLLDEPTAGLSPRASHDILASLRQVQEREKLTCIIVEHNLAEMRGWASRAVVMIQGRMVAEETDVAKLMSREYLEKHYF